MLLINVVMRPVLLTIGFILSLGMMWALTWMGAEIMSGAARVMLISVDTSLFDGSNPVEKGLNTLTTAANNVQMTLIGTVAILLIGGATMVMLIHRAFDLMYESADEVMQWVGGGVKQLGGEKENASRTTAIIAGQFGRMEGRMRGAGSMPKGPSLSKPGAGGKGGAGTGDQGKGDPGANVAEQANATPAKSAAGGSGGGTGGDQGNSEKIKSDK